MGAVASCHDKTQHDWSPACSESSSWGTVSLDSSCDSSYPGQLLEDGVPKSASNLSLVEGLEETSVHKPNATPTSRLGSLKEVTFVTTNIPADERSELSTTWESRHDGGKQSQSGGGELVSAWYGKFPLPGSTHPGWSTHHAPSHDMADQRGNCHRTSRSKTTQQSASCQGRLSGLDAVHLDGADVKNLSERVPPLPGCASNDLPACSSTTPWHRVGCDGSFHRNSCLPSRAGASSACKSGDACPVGANLKSSPQWDSCLVDCAGSQKSPKSHSLQMDEAGAHSVGTSKSFPQAGPSSPAKKPRLEADANLPTSAFDADAGSSLGTMTTVLCWGSSGDGQLGMGGCEEHKILVPREQSRLRGEEIRDIACGVSHTLVVLKNGTLYSCGSNEFGQLGRESGVTKFAPVESLKAQRVLQAAAGLGHSLALTEAREVFSWGDNSRGQLGRGQVDEETRRVPKLVKALAVYFVIQISCGYSHCIALTNEGFIFVWGCNGYGQLGVGLGVQSLDTPQALACLVGIPMRQVAGGGYHNVALSHSGAVFVWGKNVCGQLGVNDETNKAYPGQCRTLRMQRIKYVCCGEEHTAALTKEGGVFTFGLGSNGQLGHNGVLNENLPLQIMELMGSEVTQISCGRRHSLAYVAKTGRLYAFGLNTLGQLGVNSTASKNCPILVQGPFVAPPEEKGISNMQTDNNPALVIIKIFSGGNHNFVISCPAEMKPQPANFREADPRSQILMLAEEHVQQLSQLSSSHPPSVELEEEIVKIFSNAACLNGAFLKKTDGHYGCSSQNHGIDLGAAREAFKQMSNTTNVIIMQKIANSLEQSLIPNLLASPPDVEALRLYLLLPECHLFDQPKYYSSLICPLGRRMLNLDQAACRVLETWWSLLEATYFLRIVYVYKNCVSHILQLPDTANQHEVEKRGNGLYVSLELLKKLNQVNENNGQIIPYHKFYVPDLKDLVNIRRDYVSWISKGPSASQGLHFCSYPFLFDAPAKSVLLETDATLQMQSAIDETARMNISRMFLSIDPVHPCLVLYITRENIVRDTLQQLNVQKSADLKKPLKVIIMGEEAVDVGGVKKEFFLLLLREILDPKFGMFKYYEESRLIWFNPQTFEDRNMFHMIGILCGLAIYNCTIINLNFPLALYKKLLKRPVTLEDLKQLSPTEGRSLQCLLEYEEDDFEQVFELTFEMNETVFGEVKSVELCPDGKNTAVTKRNRQEYVTQYIRHILDTSVDSQFSEFNTGFHKVCGGRVLEFFHPQELQAMVIGNENYDFLELEKNTSYKDDYHRYHPTIQFFWDVFHELDMEEKKKFLLFLTGSDRIPVYGMKYIKMMIQPTGGGERFLPVAHTCFNVLDLPRYQSKEVLRAKLKMAIEQTEGFGLV